MTRLTKLDRSVAGRVAIVTGAASGMGRATAHLLADEGAHVAVTDVHREGVDAVVGEITAAGGTAVGWALDLRRPEEIRIAQHLTSQHAPAPFSDPIRPHSR